MTMFFFFNDTATTEIYTLSLHDALPICRAQEDRRGQLLHRRQAYQSRSRKRGPSECRQHDPADHLTAAAPERDRKSTRLNSSHANISYAVFCLKKKKTTKLHSHQ